jgi:hypothetical protein
MRNKKVKEPLTKDEILEEIEEILLKKNEELKHLQKKKINKKNEKAETLTEKEINKILSNLEEKYIHVTNLCVGCDKLISYNACKAYPCGIPDDIFYGKDRCLKNKMK